MQLLLNCVEHGFGRVHWRRSCFKNARVLSLVFSLGTIILLGFRVLFS